MSGVGFDAMPFYATDFAGDPAAATWLPIECSQDTSVDVSATEVDVSTRVSVWEMYELGLQAGSVTLTVFNKKNMTAEEQSAFDALLAAATGRTTISLWFSDKGDVVGSQGLAADFYIHFTKDGPLNDAQAWNFTCRVAANPSWYKKAGP